MRLSGAGLDDGCLEIGLGHFGLGVRACVGRMTACQMGGVIQ